MCVWPHSQKASKSPLFSYDDVPRRAYIGLLSALLDGLADLADSHMRGDRDRLHPIIHNGVYL